jgi:signal transduction histidine kinase/ActR/RegA family two-component response regulator
VLTRASREVAEGKLTPPPVPEGDDDVGRLGAAFNAMSRAVAERVGQLTVARNQMAVLAETSKQEHARLDALLSAMEFGVLFSDTDQKVTYANQAFARLWRLDAIGNIGLGISLGELFARLAPSASTVPEWQQESGVQVTLTREIPLMDGRILTMQRLEVSTAEGAILGRVWIFADVTKERLAAQQLIATRDAAEAATQAKAAFLATMSHEIRTPMNGIIGMTQLALGTRLDDEQKEYLELIRSSTDSLLSIVNDILDFSKIEAGRMELEVLPFELERLIGETLGILSASAEQCQIRLVSAVSPGLAGKLLGDPTRLRQILTNLTTNAIKFTPKGSVTISAQPGVMREDRRIEVLFAVTDSGIGIPEEKLASIFQPFTQADHSTSRNYGGTGLGLAIVSHLVELMGGKISVKSTPGQGSTFSFAIPLRRAEASIAPPAPGAAEANQPLTPLRILLAEDNLVNQKVAMGLLRKQGHIVTLANNGAEALAMVTEHAEDFDIILMDMQMPKLDGLEATRQIRAHENGLRHIPIVALTANASEADRQRCLESGMDDFVSKPFRIAEISAALLRHTSPQ